MTEVTLFTALMAGIVSFLSPCVLPLVPGYLSYVTGLSFRELSAPASNGSVTAPGTLVMRSVTTHSLLFVAGFTTVFVMLGASATMIGRFLLQQNAVFNVIAGAVVTVFGLHLLGAFRIPLLYREKRWGQRMSGGTRIGSYGMGAAFAFGWTPCIGPILAGVLVLAANQETVAQGMALLTVYSLGLGVPFVLAAVSVNRLLVFISRFRRFYRAVEVVSGLLLIGVGVLILTGNMTWLASRLAFLNRFVW